MVESSECSVLVRCILIVDQVTPGLCGFLRRFGPRKVKRRFGQDESGSILIFSLFLLVTLLIIAGFAVDLMRAETQRAKLQSTLDRAVLAAASTSQNLDPTEVVYDYVAKAGLESHLTEVTVDQERAAKTVSAKAFFPVETFFLPLTFLAHNKKGRDLKNNYPKKHDHHKAKQI